MDEGFTVRRRDELERSGNWLLAPRALGLAAFGLNVVRSARRVDPGDDEVERDQEEVFIVLEGSPTLVIMAARSRRRGTFARLDPRAAAHGRQPRRGDRHRPDRLGAADERLRADGLGVTYHEGSRRLQDRFDTRRLADRLEQVKVTDTIGPQDRAFIESLDMFFLATADREGRPTCSYKGGDPGFVHVLDEHTVAFPAYDGNGMFLSAGNVLVNPEVGLLFVCFERAGGCGSTARRSWTRRWPGTGRAHCSACGYGRARCSRTARATSTGWRSSSARRSCRAASRRRRCRTGNGATGRATCSRPATRPRRLRRRRA